MQIITVSELTRKIKFLLERIPDFRDIWVSGEISNFKHHSSGHMYFTMKDDAGSLRCVMFRSRTTNLLFRPENGMKVLARGNISLYERDGQYQLYVEELQPDGIGALHTAFEQLKEKLQREGLFDPDHKRKLPLLPRTLGIVTSPTGAAIRDILTVIRRRCPNIHIIIAPVAVQGDNAPAEIADGIELLNSYGGVDLIITGRGGGSLEELWAFNTEVVARSIYNSAIPVISAVGHEVDFTIADFVADMRAPTPSAAAEIAVPDKKEMQRHLQNMKNRLENAARGYLNRQKGRLDLCRQNYIFREPKGLVNQLWQQLDYLHKFLNQGISRFLDRKHKETALLAGRLNALSPLSTLERGYSICQKDGLVLKDAASIEKGQQVQVWLHRGKLNCTVDSKEDLNV